MAKMSKELLDLINNVMFCYLATASKEGVPDVIPIGSIRAVSPDTIVMTAGQIPKSLRNLKENRKAAILVLSSAPSEGEVSIPKLLQVHGGQIKGTVEVMTSGDIHEQMKDMVAELVHPEVARKLRATLILHVEEISYIGLWPVAEKIIA